MLVLTISDMAPRPVVKTPLSNKSPNLIKYIFRQYRQAKENPLVATGEAIAEGVAISQIDGPLPVMDTIGAAWSVKEAAEAWVKYASE